ncbi:MAG TPA: ABC transporter permease [Candidatus Saccharimonadales bacterium]|nr:ABC transporter permease [Candidatus Saccharimonadales bacterium]
MISDNLHMAITSIRSSRLRSFLTSLGIIIGVFSVITSISLADGVRHQVISETNKLGNDVLTVRPGRPVHYDKKGSVLSEVNIFGPATTGAVLDEKDLAAIRDSEDITQAVPLNLVSGVPLFNGKTMDEAIVIGTTPGLPTMLTQDIQFGKFFDSNETDKNVAVVGAGVAEKLFGENVPIGQIFTVRGKSFAVEGVIERYKTVSVSQGIDFNNAIFLPYQPAKKINSGVANSFEILARVRHPDAIDKTEDSLRQSLKQSHGGQEDFTILQAGDTQVVTGSVLDLVTTMVAGIAIISMLVGGIGIMDIMLVSVSERTREIGIRKAVGATDHQIRKQFLLEAAVLSIWGAFIGVVISLLFNVFIRIVTNLQPVIPWKVVLLSMLASIFLGVIFGTAPAIKASRKDPIDALRSGLY